MLAQALTGVNWSELLLSPPDFRPYPTIADRDRWRSVSQEVKLEYVSAAEENQKREWPAIPATLFMDFYRTGNRRRFHDAHFLRRQMLTEFVLAECIEDKGRFIDNIVDGLWFICEETYWGLSAHRQGAKQPKEPLPDVDDPVIDLFAAETASLLAWTNYLLQQRLDAVTPVVGERIRREIKQRITRPYLEQDYRWMGFQPGAKPNNWNPWINSNCLAVTLLLEEEPHIKKAIIEKAIHSVDKFIAGYPPDGACDEGAHYWNYAAGSLFNFLEYLFIASGEKISFWHEPLIQNMGRYIYRVFIGGNSFLNVADGNRVVTPPPHLVYHFGNRVGDQLLAGLGRHLYRNRNDDEVKAARALHNPEPIYRLIPEVLASKELATENGAPPFLKDVWFPDRQLMVAREEADKPSGLYLAAKGGHNDEAHNHNDVGEFVVYVDGQPVLIDPGVAQYTATTFSARRYDLWAMQSAYHNVPLINGYPQSVGPQFQATDVHYAVSDAVAALSMDLARSYPKETNVTAWHRTVSLNRSQNPQVVVSDKFRLAEPTASLASVLLTPRHPEPAGPGALLLPGTVDVIISYNDDLLYPDIEPITLDDPWLQGAWGERLYRILLRARQPVQEGAWTVKVYARR